MRYEFTGRAITVTPALKKHAREHLDKLDRILDSAPMRAHIVLDVEKHRQNAEIVVYWKDHVFNSRQSTKDMYDSITQAADKINAGPVQRPSAVRPGCSAGRGALRSQWNSRCAAAIGRSLMLA